MPKSALKFGQELQSILQPMVIKPSTAGGVSVSIDSRSANLALTAAQALQETVATLCTAVKHITHNFQPLVGLLKSCDGNVDFPYPSMPIIEYPNRPTSERH